ncbi:MAG: hypothetical protein KBS89_00595 [Bacteroidales bacterium]|nr:hypothetical protein [Candidatus Egerieousia equi]
MFKKILKYFTIAVLGAAAALYFFFVSSISAAAGKNEVVRKVDIVIKDSAQLRFLDKDIVRNIYFTKFGNPEGKNIRMLRLGAIEDYLNSQSAIKKVQVMATTSGVLRIEIEQRKPVFRLATAQGGFYVDETGYIYPLQSTFTSYVPVVSGNIPVIITDNANGLSYKDEKGWMKEMVTLASYIDANPFWNSMIEQMNVNEKGDLELYTQVGNARILFGDLHKVQAKFNKLMTFYKKIAPVWGWERYKEINLKYDNQIVCVLNKKN